MRRFLSPLLGVALLSTLTPLSHAEELELPDINPSALSRAATQGLVIKASPYSVAETEARFLAVLAAQGLNVFATIDHAANAAGVDLDLPPTRVVIFGNPNAGTPLMQCAPSLAIDLPQKVLIWADQSGQAQLAYNDPMYLAERHQLGDCGQPVIQNVTRALDTLTSRAIAP